MSDKPNDQSADVLICTESAMLSLDGAPVMVHKGVTRARAGHPLVTEYPDFWEPITVQYDVETARQEPKAPKRGAGSGD